jgi:hypothetical protein
MRLCFGGDRDRLYIGSQSSSGHLATVALTTDWLRDSDLPASSKAAYASAACTI